MGPRTLEYTLQYIKRNKPLFLATLIVIALTTFILNLFISISYATYTLSLQIQKQQKASVLFEPLTPKEEVIKLARALKELPEVTNIQITDSGALKQESLQSLGIKPEEFDTTTQEENLLPILRIELDPNQPHDEVINLLKNEQKSNPKVIRIIYFEEVARRINVISRTLKYSGLLITGVLILISAYLIYLTMQFSVFSIEDEIRTMKLVGASGNQVILPFALQGALLGALGTITSALFTLMIIAPFGYVQALSPVKRIVTILVQHLGLTNYLTWRTFLTFFIVETFVTAILTFIISYAATKKIFKKIL